MHGGVLNQKNHKVCGSAQTTGGLGVTFKPFKGFRIGADWTFSARNYSDYFLDASSSLVQNGEITLADPWEIPWGNELDLSCSYSFKIGGLNATVCTETSSTCSTTIMSRMRRLLITRTEHGEMPHMPYILSAAHSPEIKNQFLRNYRNENIYKEYTSCRSCVTWHDAV